jgi:hypothetical protein
MHDAGYRGLVIFPPLSVKSGYYIQYIYQDTSSFVYSIPNTCHAHVTLVLTNEHVTVKTTWGDLLPASGSIDINPPIPVSHDLLFLFLSFEDSVWKQCVYSSSVYFIFI